MQALTCMNIIMIMALSLLAMTKTSNAQDSPKDFLNAHNGVRAQLGVGMNPLMWDDNLAAYAWQYANSHISDCSMVHSGGPYGENLAWSSGNMWGSDAVKLWVNERVDYDYRSNTCRQGKVCGHYTQVVWRNSARLGCAKVRCNSGATLIGCNYDPPGNWIGERPY